MCTDGEIILYVCIGGEIISYVCIGGEIISENISDCTVLVTDKIRRTAKFLCMVARGVPIVSPSWISQSKSLGTFLDPWSYILKERTIQDN